MAERPAPLVPYSVFKQQQQQSKTSPTAAARTTSSLPVRSRAAPARSHVHQPPFDARQTASPNTEHRRIAPGHQDGAIRAKKQQLDRLRKVVAQLEKEVGADGSTIATPELPTPLVAAEPAGSASQDTTRQTQGQPNPEEKPVDPGVSRDLTRVQVHPPKPGGTGFDEPHQPATATVVNATARRPRAGRHRRRSLEHTPSWEQKPAKLLAPLSMRVASSGGRGQQSAKQAKNNLARSRRSSMPSVMGFGRFA